MTDRRKTYTVYRQSFGSQMWIFSRSLACGRDTEKRNIGIYLKFPQFSTDLKRILKLCTEGP